MSPGVFDDLGNEVALRMSGLQGRIGGERTTGRESEDEAIRATALRNGVSEDEVRQAWARHKAWAREERAR